jgi:hypothetical protein
VWSRPPWGAPRVGRRAKKRPSGTVAIGRPLERIGAALNRQLKRLLWAVVYYRPGSISRFPTKLPVDCSGLPTEDPPVATSHARRKPCRSQFPLAQYKPCRSRVCRQRTGDGLAKGAGLCPHGRQRLGNGRDITRHHLTTGSRGCRSSGGFSQLVSVASPAGIRRPGAAASPTGSIGTATT